jgi:hypothetical protein
MVPIATSITTASPNPIASLVPTFHFIVVSP